MGFLLAVVVLITTAPASAQKGYGRWKNSGYTVQDSVALATDDTLTIPNGTYFYLTGTAKILRIQPVAQGRLLILYHSTTDTLVDGGNLVLNGNFNATAGDIIQLIGDAAGTNWVEISRSAN